MELTVSAICLYKYFALLKNDIFESSLYNIYEFESCLCIN